MARQPIQRRRPRPRPTLPPDPSGDILAKTLTEQVLAAIGTLIDNIASIASGAGRQRGSTSCFVFSSGAGGSFQIRIPVKGHIIGLLTASNVWCVLSTNDTTFPFANNTLVGGAIAAVMDIATAPQTNLWYPTDPTIPLWIFLQGSGSAIIVVEADIE